MTDVRRRVKSLGKRLPPIAWRDQQIADLREEVRHLRSEVRRHGGKPAPSVSSRPGAGPRLRTSEQVQLVRDSGLFDTGWYLRQLAGTDVADPVEHYVRSGHREGYTATPYLLERLYRSSLSGQAARQPPLVHYLTQGRSGTIPVHPGFPIQEYVEALPASVDHPGGPLGHYLDGGGDHPAAPPTVLPVAQFRQLTDEAVDMLEAARGYEHLPRQSPTFDTDAERAFKADLLGDRTLLVDPPKVTVVLPTKDRSSLLRVAMSSVVAQTYRNWELIVVDDGSVEDIAAVVAEYASDPRVSLLRHPENKGVAAARNTALAAATGTFAAYLDSDNTWKPDFLELMVRHLERTGSEVGYCATALIEQAGAGRQVYRGMPFSRGALRERNYIDCIVVVHRRSLIDQVGGFDESLRRTVDWDLLIRLADVTEFSYAPFIGSEYDLWEEGGDRITTDVAEGYRWRVRQRTLVDWEAARASVPQRGAHLSIVIAVSQPVEDLVAVLERVHALTREPHEIVVIDNHLAEHESVRLYFAVSRLPGARMHRLSQRLPHELGRNLGITMSTGQTIAVLHERTWVTAGWEQDLIKELDTHVAVQPLLLTRGGAVYAAGISFAGDGRPHRAYHGFSGDAPELRATFEVDAVSAACCVARAGDLIRIEGFDPLYLRDDLGPAISVRLREATDRTVAVVGSSTVSFRRDPAPLRKPAAIDADLRNERLHALLWERTGLVAMPEYARSGYRVEGYVREVDNVRSMSPVLVHDRPQRPLRWAIKIGVYSMTERENWGDWHFAQALQRSLEHLGHEVTIDAQPAWYRPTSHLDDVALFLQGRGRYQPLAGQVSAVWVYSHPSAAPLRDLADFDLTYSASQAWCRKAASHSRSAPQLLLQCTDPERFRPVPPDESAAHDLLMVGNARSARGMRGSVRVALEAGFVPDVYGKNWAGLLPPAAWKGEYLPNEQLATHYASSGVVLNDHWEEMQEWGLLSNRLFDLAACGARVVSDHVDGIEDVFGDVVLTYTSPESFARAVQIHRDEDAGRAQRRMELSRVVQRDHSFQARAARLSDDVLAVLRERSSRTPLGAGLLV